MTSRWARGAAVLGGALLAVVALAAPADATPIIFSGASVMGVNPGGSGAGYSLGENSTGLITNGGAQDVNTAYITTGTLPATPSFVDTAVTANLGFSLASVGSYNFTLYRTDFSATDRVLNLFFDGAGAPGISAYEQLGSNSFTATSSANLVPLTSNSQATVNGSGTLAYDNGSFTATLTALDFQTGLTVNGFTLGTHALTPGGSTSGLGGATFTLNVTADALSAPEPGSIALLSAGLVALGLVRRRTSKV